MPLPRALRLQMIAPIAVRELIVASRRPMNWRARLIMTGCALLAALVGLASARSLSSAGSGIFSFLSFLLFTYAMLAGFLFTADSIAEERREGTFGLLYLTPLSSWDVIAGKLASTSLQGVFGLVAVIPILALSVLAGGVTGQDVTRVVSVLAATLFLSLSAGIFASAASQSRRGAIGLTGLLTIGPLFGGCVAVIVVAVLAYVSEQEKRKRANVYWFTGYGLLVLFLMWMVSVSGSGLVGSPGQALSAVWRAPTNTQFIASVAALIATGVFYLFSATLCTEWYRAAREIVVASNEQDREVDEIFFPGLRFQGRVGNDPAHWLLSFLQSTPFLFYVALALMIVMNLSHGAAPTAIGRSFVFFFFALLPYILFTFTLARYCAAPFHLLERTGFLETLFTTPIRPQDLVRAQRWLFWKMLRLPLLLLVLASVPGSLWMFAQGIFTAESSLGATIVYLLHWMVGWFVFALQLETIAVIAMRNSLLGRNPMNSALRATATVLVPGLLINILFPIAWNLARWSGFSGYFVFQLIGEFVLAGMFLAVLSRARRSLGLSSHLLRP